MRGILTNNFVRGGVSGLGLLNLLAAAAELVDILGWGRDRRPDPGPFGEHGLR